MVLIIISLITVFCTPTNLPITLSQGETIIENGGSFSFETSGEYLVFTIENTGTENVTITDIALSGDGMEAFSFSEDFSETTLSSGGTAEFELAFLPTAEATFTATVTMSLEDYTDDFTFEVSGTYEDTPPVENDWTELNPSQSPAGRGNFSMTYTDNGKVIIYGGASSSPDFLNDIWEYNNMTKIWTEIVPEGTTEPEARNQPRIVYIENNKILMFGGNNFDSGRLNDTWIFDLTTKEWTDVTPTGTKPLPRNSNEMVYIGNDKVILFGGTTGTDYLNDVWEFNTSTYSWTELMANNPSPTNQPEVRSGHSMVYIGNDKILSFGGSNWVTDIIYFDDTWIYDINANSWTEITGTPHPIDRSGAGIAYDDDNNIVVLFSGYSDSGSGNQNDTWEFDVTSETWTEITTSNTPAIRTSCRMIYTGNNRVIMFGGREGNNPTTYYNETWEYGVTSSN